MKRFKPLFASLLLSLFVLSGIGAEALTTSYNNSNNNQIAYAQSHKKKKIKKAKAKKSVIVYITETGKKYHRAGCRHLKKSCISISKQDAINKGYTACSKCHP